LTQLNDHIDAQRTLPDTREPRAGLGTRLGTKNVCYFPTVAFPGGGARCNVVSMADFPRNFSQRAGIAVAVLGAAALALILTTGVTAGVYQEISRKEPQR